MESNKSSEPNISRYARYDRGIDKLITASDHSQCNKRYVITSGALSQSL